MFGLSFGEILFLGALALVVVGPKQLPELARNLGRFMNDLKRATDGFTSDLKNQAKIDFDLNRRTPLDQQQDFPTPSTQVHHQHEEHAMEHDGSNAIDGSMPPQDPHKPDKPDGEHS